MRLVVCRTRRHRQRHRHRHRHRQRHRHRHRPKHWHTGRQTMDARRSRDVFNICPSKNCIVRLDVTHRMCCLASMFKLQTINICPSKNCIARLDVTQYKRIECHFKRLGLILFVTTVGLKIVCQDPVCVLLCFIKSRRRSDLKNEISRSMSFPDRCFKWQGLHVMKTRLKFWELPWQRVWYVLRLTWKVVWKFWQSWLL